MLVDISEEAVKASPTDPQRQADLDKALKVIFTFLLAIPYCTVHFVCKSLVSLDVRSRFYFCCLIRSDADVIDGV